MMNHVALLGDSIFDNASYVPGELPVIEQLKEVLPTGWVATLLAVDGDVTLDVIKQLSELPDDVTHLIISCGGNDALRSVDVLNERAATVGKALDRLTDIRLAFQENYKKMLTTVSSFGKPTAVCTIYDAIPGLGARAATALCLFNEVILKEAFSFKIPVIDLRLICTDASDYSQLSPIEPSSQGGKKIVGVIKKLVAQYDGTVTQSQIYT